SRDRPPFGTVVEPPDNRFNRAPILLAGPRATNLHRHNRRFELRPLGIRQDLHRLATPMPNKISRPVTSASHQLRTDPSSDRRFHQEHLWAKLVIGVPAENARYSHTGPVGLWLGDERPARLNSRKRGNKG